MFPKAVIEAPGFQERSQRGNQPQQLVPPLLLDASQVRQRPTSFQVTHRNAVPTFGKNDGAKCGHHGVFPGCFGIEHKAEGT